MSLDSPLEELRALVAEIRQATSERYAQRVLDRVMGGIGWKGATLEELPTKELRLAVRDDLKAVAERAAPSLPPVTVTNPAELDWRHEELKAAGLAQPAPAAADTEHSAQGSSQAQADARARQAMGAKGWKRAQSARRTQVRAQARAKLKAEHHDHYTDGGFGRIPNLVVALLPVIPAPVLKAYLVSCRLANLDGTFEISHQSLAEWIGSRHRTHAERAMRRLVNAGLVSQRWRGGPGRPNGYRLVSLAKLDLETTKVILSQPLTLSGANKHRGRGHAACA